MGKYRGELMEYVFLLLGIVNILNGILFTKRTDEKSKRNGKLLILIGIALFVCSTLILVF